MNRTNLLSETALLGIFALCLFPKLAVAACDISTPTAGQTVTCSGSDTTGISGGANNVTVNMNTAANVTTTGQSAISLGNMTIITNGGGTIRSNATTITIGSGSITGGASSVISSTTGTAIQYTGPNGGVLVIINTNVISGAGGTAIDFGQAQARYRIGSAAVTTGNVIAGNGTTDALELLGTTNGTFNVSEIGTKYIGFENFLKTNTSQWTLTGSGNQSWGISGGILRGDTSSMGGNLSIGASGNATFNQTVDGTYSGIISGAGNITKIGSGTLTLASANTYSGGTTISAGSLSGTTSSIQGNITNNSILNFNQNSNGIYSSVISGSGSLTKTGTGNVTFSGINTYTGGTTVSNGRLSVNGAIAGTTTIANSGILGGIGNFGTIINNGRIAPGNSIGIMNVTGPVTFNPGSAFEIEVDAAGNRDQLIASGAITINGGTVDVRAASGVYVENTFYNNILQGSSRTGIFDSITSNLAFLTPTLLYDATSVDLLLTRNNLDFSTVAEDPVQVGVANAVQGLGIGNDLFEAFSGLTVSDASNALDVLSGEHNSGITTATAQSVGTIRNLISNRVHSLNSFRESNRGSEQSFALLSPSAGYEDASIRQNFWSEAFSVSGNSDKVKTAPAQSRESGGVLFGAEAEFSSDFFAGIFGGYESGEIYTQSQFANSDITSWYAGIYTNQQITPSWYISTSLIGSYHDIDTTRHITFTGFSETPKGETDGYTISPSIETGYNFATENFNIEPFVGLTLTHSYIDSYFEEQGGSANLDVDSISQTNFSHITGVRLGKSFDVSDETEININTQLGWNHTYGDLEPTQEMRFISGNLPFEVIGAGLARDSAVFGLNADINLTAIKGKAYINYSGSLSKDDDQQGITLGVKVPF